MDRIAVRLTMLLGLVMALLAIPAPGSAAVQGSIYVATASKQISRNGTAANLSVSCTSGFTPAFGGYYDSAGADIRLLDEILNYGSGASYSIDVYDNDAVGGVTTVTIEAVCIWMVNFSAETTQTASFTVQSDHVAVGAVSCPSNYLALGASVYFSGASTTVLTSSPYSGLGAWIARGWNQTIGASMVVSVRCVLGPDIPSFRVYSHTDYGVGWGTTVSASCPVGFAVLTGGTLHDGDGQAITIDPQIVNRTLTSRALSATGGNMVTTVVCVPVSLPVVTLTGSATPEVTSTTAQWQFTATDPAAAGGYTMATTCTLQDVNAGWTVVYQNQPCSSPKNESALHEGTFMLTVTATTSDGRWNDAFWPVTIDHSVPVVAFADPAGAPHGTTSVSVQAQVSDTYSLVTSLTCALDNATPSTCGTGQFGYSNTEPGCSNGCTDYRGAQQFNLSGLSDGLHVLHVKPTDSRTNTHTYDLPFKVDTVAPTVTQTGPSVPFTVALKATVTWTGSDAVSGIAAYGVRWRKAPYNADYGAWSTPVTTAPTATSRTFGSLVPGSTYCFAVDATDKAGNVSAWKPSRCIAIPLDDRALADSGGWTPVAASGYFAGTAMTSKKLGATLSATSATVKRVAVVAKTCPTCGTVGVYVAGHLLAKVNLKASVTARKLIVLPAFTLTTGTVKLKVLSSGKQVQIDALGLSRV